MVLALLARLTAPPHQTLLTHAPTPSTVTYSVSTRPVPSTVAAKLLHYASILTRLLVGVLVLLTLWTRYRLTHGQSTNMLLYTLGGPRTATLLKALGSVGWGYTIATSLVLLFLVLWRGYTVESLTLLRTLGIQLQHSPPTYLQRPTSRFIPATDIQDIFIHEAFRGFEVVFYLAVVVKGEEDVVVVFPGLRPKREVLEVVWRGARGCLWEGGRRGVDK